jgi:hypothetical protein
LVIRASPICRVRTRGDEDFAYSVWDYTPTERREDQGQGDPEPNTMALRIVKERVLKARGEDGDGEDRITAKQVWEQLVGEITGQGRKAPSSKTVRRWLDRWVTNGVLVEGKKRVVSGSDKPVTTYTLPPPRVRCPLRSVLWSLLLGIPCRNRKKQWTTAQLPSMMSIALRMSIQIRKARDNDQSRNRLSIALFQSPRAISRSKDQRTAPRGLHARARARLKSKTLQPSSGNKPRLHPRSMAGTTPFGQADLFRNGLAR